MGPVSTLHSLGRTCLHALIDERQALRKLDLRGLQFMVQPFDAGVDIGQVTSRTNQACQFVEGRFCGFQVL